VLWTPARVVTSSNVPSPRFRYRTLRLTPEKVHVAVVVVVAGGGAHGVARAPQARSVGDVGEAETSFVVEQAVPILRRLLLERRKGGAVGEVDVRPAVAVVVEDGQAPGHRLDEVLLRARVVLDPEHEAGRGRPLAEADGGRRRSRGERPEQRPRDKTGAGEARAGEGHAREGITGRERRRPALISTEHGSRV
jgi:hypothetical protein